MSNPRNKKLLELIEKDDQLTLAFARNKTAIEKLLVGIKFNIVEFKNKDDIGDVIMAFKYIEEIFDDVILRGEAVEEQMQKEAKKKKEQ